MNSKYILILLLCMVGLTACQPAEPVCIGDSIRYVDTVQQLPPLAALPADSEKSQIPIEIKGKTILFDDVISGPLCNNHLSGKVYITCDLDIVAWEVAPNFLDGCDFEVEAGSEVIVASHNNAAYYKGCDSCHKSSQ